MAVRSSPRSPSEEPPERSGQRLAADRNADELAEELEEIKREIVESRALSIKTNNLVNGLSADIHGIGKRQRHYERSLKFSSVGFYAVVLALVVTGAKLIIDARVELERGVAEELQSQVARLEREVKLSQGREEARAQAERRAAEFQEVIALQNRAEVLERWPEVERLPLTRTERVTFERAVERFRNEASLLAYHAGLDHVRAERWFEAERALRTSLESKEDATHADEARYQLARALKNLDRPRDAISLLLDLAEGPSAREVSDDAAFLLAQAQLELEAWNDAKATLRSFLRRFPSSPHRFQARADLERLRTER